VPGKLIIAAKYEQTQKLCVFSGFRREVDENRALLRYYTASSGNFLPTFRDNVLVLSSGVKNPKEGFFTLEGGIDMLSRNVCKKLPLLAA
jgi:hypothetical protein